MARLNPTYLDFHQLRRKAELLFDEVSEQVLIAVAEAHRNQETLNVSDVIMRPDIASPATLHKRLTKLERDGFISIEPIPFAYPRKSIELTDKGIKAVNDLGKFVRQAAKK